MESNGLCEGGIVVGVVGFRVNGLTLPIAVHYPNGRVHQVVCGRCADSGKTGPGVACTACIQPDR